LTQIGQFGVGFYSTFLVGDTVTVVSKHDDDDQYIWESSAESDTSFDVIKDPRGNTLTRGTLVTIHVKEDAKDYLDWVKLKDLILRYNEFIGYPIYLWTKKEVEREVPDEPEEKQEETETPKDVEVEDVKEPKMKTIKEDVWDWEHINTAEPLWRRRKNEITEKDFTEFYQNVLKSDGAPLHYLLFKAEGDLEFTGLVYIPEKSPYGQWDAGYTGHFKLYVKRVFVTDNFEEFLPKYLSFIKGLVDSDDFDLNISREVLQKSKTLQLIKKRLVRKIVAMFQDLADSDKEKYMVFYENYASNIKLGIMDDPSNRDRLAQLLRFYTYKHKDEMISLDKYVEEMRPKQNEIFFLSGENKESVLSSPLLEKLTKKGYDVVLMTEPIDEYVMQVMYQYLGKYKFQNLGKEEVDVTKEKKKKELEEEYKPLTDYLKEILGDKISKVTISTRLTTTPAVVVAPTYGITPTMKRIMKNQPLSDSSRAQHLMSEKNILDINPKHPIVVKLLTLVKEGAQDKTTEDISRVLYETATISSGFSLEDPAELTTRVYRLLSKSLGVSEDFVYEEEPEPEESDEGIEIEPEDIPEEVINAGDDHIGHDHDDL